MRQAIIQYLQGWLKNRYNKHIVEIKYPFHDMQELLLGTDIRGIVDGGAYHGVIAQQLSSLFPLAEVYAFEPAGKAFNVLQQNVRGNPRIKPFNVALSSGDDRRPLYLNVQDSTNSLSLAGKMGQKYQSWQTENIGQEVVTLVSLDHWVDMDQIATIDLIKLDVQGHELEALRGAEKLLRSTIKVIYTEVEFVQVYQENCLLFEIESFLRPLGFDLFQLYNLTSGDDNQLVCADAIFIARERIESRR